MGVAEIVLDRVSGAHGVADVSFTVGDGECVVLLGPAESGKSAVLNLVAGLADITSGELRIGGVRMNETAPWRRELGLVLPAHALYPHLTVRENLAFGLRLARLPEPDVRHLVDEEAERLDLVAHLDHKPTALPGSRRFVVAFGRAVVRRPKALLLDQPMADLDPKVTAKLRAMVSGVQAELGITTLYATSDHGEAEALGDRIVVLRDGGIDRIVTGRAGAR